MDLSYATIPIFGGQYQRLYREAKLLYVVIDAKKSKNLPVYTKEESMGYYILSINPEAITEANVPP